MRKSLFALAIGGAILAGSAVVPAPASAETYVTTSRPDRVVVYRKKPRKIVRYDQYGNRHVTIIRNEPRRVIVRERPSRVIVRERPVYVVP
jgi:hypothetical protein